jgi:hypothetical protein
LAHASTFEDLKYNLTKGLPPQGILGSFAQICQDNSIRKDGFLDGVASRKEYFNKLLVNYDT